MSGTTDAPDKLQALRAQLAAATTPAERVEATLKLAEELWLKDPVTVRPLLEQVVAEADAAGRPSDRGRAAYMLEVRPETGGLGHATPSNRGEYELLSPFHLADEIRHEKQEESQL